jgi:hypothetical protein
MRSIKEIHQEAMDLAEEGFVAKKKGDEHNASSSLSKALELEQKAADSMDLIEESEPTRSILYRSAASLAFNIGDFPLCDRLIARGLSGFPPPEIEEELKNLFEDVNFMRHLSAKGVVLDPSQWLMTISGNSTKYGGAAADQLLVRVEKIKTLFYRTVERLLDRPYREKGSVDKTIKDAYGLYINAFQPSSFSVSFQVGKPDPQMSLFPELKEKKTIEPNDIVDEIFSCFEIFEKNEAEKLKEKIKDENYHGNFIGLAKEIAPDGNNVKLVGFTAIRDGKEKPVALRRNRKEIRAELSTSIDSESVQSDGPFSMSGILMRASTPLQGKFGTVTLVETKTAQRKTINVPISIMKDVVQPYYEESVTVHCTKKSKKIILDEIELSSDS